MIKLILNNSFLGGMITSIASVPAALTTLPCTNLVNGMRHKFCRIIPSGNTLTITVTLSAEAAIAAVGMGGFGLTGSATCRCLIKDAATTTVYDSGTIDIYSHATQALLPWWSKTKFWLIGNSVNAKTIAITINNTITPIDLSHIVFGTDITPSVNPDWGASWNWVETSIQQRTAGGSLLSNPNYGHRKMQMTWSLLPNTDWTNLSNLLQSQGQSLMFSLMPGENSRRESDLQMIGRLVSADGINLTNYDVNSLASIIIEEI